MFDYFLLSVVSALLLLAAMRRNRQTLTSTSSSPSPSRAAWDVVSAIRAVLEPPRSTLHALLTSRAGANLRLLRSFQLSNTFVDGNADVHRDFVAQARGLIHLQFSLRARLAFSELCSTVVNNCLSNFAEENGNQMLFDDFVQVVTFKTIVPSLFDTSIDDMGDEDVLFCAHAINKLWQLSKQPVAVPPELLPNLNSHLKRWLPGLANPLDFIIPTYETMWRVVATTVALIIQQHSSIHRSSFINFLHHPDRQQFQYWASPEEPSVEAVVEEAIRLYPPTRRISRVVQLTQSTDATLAALMSILASPHSPPVAGNVTVVADVACLHRDPIIWGPASSDFDPARFHPSRLTEVQKSSLMGFGYGQLKCVAKDWAPLTAAVIAAAILNTLNGQEYVLEEGSGIGARDGWDGWKIIKVTDAA